MPGNVVWSTRGDKLIIPVSDGLLDFAVAKVSECGRRVSIEHEVAVCGNDANMGRAMWTANKVVTPPSGYSSVCPESTMSATSTPPAVPTPTATPFATPILDTDEGREFEDKVLGFGGYRDAEVGCSLVYWEASTGSVRARVSGAGMPGRVAGSYGASTLVDVPTTDGDGGYYAWFNDGDNSYDPAAGWSQAYYTSAIRAAIPFGGLSMAWADGHILMSYRDRLSGEAKIGLFERPRAGGPAPDAVIDEVVMPDGVPAEILLERFHGDDAMNRYGGRAWIVTDEGKLWDLDIEDMAVMRMGELRASMPTPVPIPGDGGIRARRVHAVLSESEEYLLMSGWGVPRISIVDLADGSVESQTISGVTRIGELAVNYGWENKGLIAAHAGSEILLFRLTPDGRLVELSRHRLLPAGEYSLPGHLAWTTNGLSVVASVAGGHERFAVLRLLKCGMELKEIYSVEPCSVDGPTAEARHLITNNRFYPAPSADFRPQCPISESNPSSTVYLPLVQSRGR